MGRICGILFILAVTMAMILWGKWRHDIVAIGASCAFLTPIGHQNNTLIFGPSGFRFSDYWKLGLPLEFIVVAICVIAMPLFWSL